MQKVIVLVLLAGLHASTALAADQPLAWPQFRGPDGSGVADDQKPPVEIGPDKNVKWKVAGPQRPVLADRRRRQARHHRLRRRQALHHRLPPRRRQGGLAAPRRRPSRSRPTTRPRAAPPPPRPPPTASGSSPTSVRAASICYDLAGKELWKYEMPTASAPGDFGSGYSPILADGLVVLVRDELKDPRRSSPSTRPPGTSRGRRSGGPPPPTARRSSGTRPPASRSPLPGTAAWSATT